jgi:hypothetical protein
MLRSGQHFLDFDFSGACVGALLREQNRSTQQFGRRLRQLRQRAVRILNSGVCYNEEHL